MPVAVKCTCGKVFKVRDEFAGTIVTCQVCGASVTVPMEDGEGPSIADKPAPRAAAGGEAQTAQPACEMMSCPACAESIPASSLKCPYCSEMLKGHLSRGAEIELVKRMMAALDAHLANPQSVDDDRKLKGAAITPLTIVLAALALGGIVMCVASSPLGDAGPILITIGVLFLVIFGIAALVSLVRDAQANSIQKARNAAVAYERYLRAVRTRRIRQAYAALAPGARNVGEVAAVRFENIRVESRPRSIISLTSFGEYWKSILAGASLETRTTGIKAVRVTEDTGMGIAVVEAQLEFASYPTLLVLTILICILVPLILILIVQKKERRTIRKVMVRRGGKWFVADGEFEGVIDSVSTASLIEAAGLFSEPPAKPAGGR